MKGRSKSPVSVPTERARRTRIDKAKFEKIQCSDEE